eukprot:2783387-Pyramimonas_sp.AAC.1
MQCRKEACSDTSAQAEVPHSHLTCLRYYTLEVHPPTPIGNLFHDIMHGNLRCDILPPPTPRGLTTTQHSSPPTTSDYDLRGHWIG